MRSRSRWPSSRSCCCWASRSPPSTRWPAFPAHRFAWTQGITRRRWLAIGAGWLILAAAVIAGAVSALVTWWSGPGNALNASAFQANSFDVTDIVPVGYAIFAMALGICAGVLLRRTVPALAVTLAGFAALRVLIAQWLRPHYMTPVTVYWTASASRTAAPSPTSGSAFSRVLPLVSRVRGGRG